MRKCNYLSILLVAIFLQNCSHTKKTEPEYYTADDYKKVEKIDAHVHILTTRTFFIKQSKEDNFRLLNINVDAPSVRPFEEQRAISIEHLNLFPDRMAYAATFSVKN